MPFRYQGGSGRRTPGYHQPVPRQHNGFQAWSSLGWVTQEARWGGGEGEVDVVCVLRSAMGVLVRPMVPLTGKSRLGPKEGRCILGQRTQNPDCDNTSLIACLYWRAQGKHLLWGQQRCDGTFDDADGGTYVYIFMLAEKATTRPLPCVRLRRRCEAQRGIKISKPEGTAISNFTSARLSSDNNLDHNKETRIQAKRRVPRPAAAGQRCYAGKTGHRHAMF